MLQTSGRLRPKRKALSNVTLSNYSVQLGKICLKSSEVQSGHWSSSLLNTLTQWFHHISHLFSLIRFTTDNGQIPKKVHFVPTAILQTHRERSVDYVQTSTDKRFHQWRWDKVQEKGDLIENCLQTHQNIETENGLRQTVKQYNSVKPAESQRWVERWEMARKLSMWCTRKSRRGILWNLERPHKPYYYLPDTEVDTNSVSKTVFHRLPIFMKGHLMEFDSHGTLVDGNCFPFYGVEKIASRLRHVKES